VYASADEALSLEFVALLKNKSSPFRNELSLYKLIHGEFMEFGFIIILYVFVCMYCILYVLYIVCIVYCMYCFDLKWNSHVDSINVSLRN
jgi:hypothetical protein